MPLVLNEEQEMLRDMARGYLTDKAPVTQLRKLRDAEDETGFSRETWRDMAEMGWSGVLVGEDHGGVDMGFMAMGVIAEEMGRTLTASPFISTAVMAATALRQAGGGTHDARWLPSIVAGEAVIALALDEGRKHDPAKTAMQAERHGNGFKLNGAKSFVADGHIADAMIVAARTAGSPGEEQGLTLFLVEKDAAGLDAARTMMVDSRNAARVTFHSVDVTADAVLGEVDNGGVILDRALNAGRAALAAELSGSAQEGFERTVAYLKERKQFGEVIGTFQALQHRCAHLFTELELARSIMMKALQTLDEAPDHAGHIVAAAKAKVSQVARLSASEAVQMHGGIGMTDEHEIGFFMKRIRVASEMLGDANYHADRLAKMQQY